jgi:hypothetical protein
MSWLNLLSSPPIEPIRPRFLKQTPTVKRIDQVRQMFHSPRPTGGIQEQVIRLHQLIEVYEEKTQQLRSSLNHLLNSSNSQFAISAFTQTLDRYRQRLTQRHAKLLDSERTLTLFRPKEFTFSVAPTRQELRMPPRQKFVLSLPEISQQKVYIKSEHAYLTDTALMNSRLIIFARMQLKLAHDQRDLETLRKRLKRILSDEEKEEGMERERLKERCRKVKNEIEYEKNRIKQEKWICADEFFAAVAIQSAWRGFWFRRTHRF